MLEVSQIQKRKKMIAPHGRHRLFGIAPNARDRLMSHENVNFGPGVVLEKRDRSNQCILSANGVPRV
jgi:hypothetical protein